MMAALSPIVTTALPVFSGVTGYLNQQDKLDQTAQANAANQQVAEQKLQLQQQKLQLQEQKQAAAAGGSGPGGADKAAAAAAAAAERRQQTADRLQAEQDLQMQQLQDRQQADTAVADARIQNQMDEVQTSAIDAELARRDALRQSLAKTTVSLAGQGIDPTDGSGAAIQAGQIAGSDRQRQNADQATQLRLKALSQQADALNQQNLLEQSQLAQRQRLQWLNTFG